MIELKKIIFPFHAQNMRLKDPWGNLFYYRFDGKSYWIGSGGSDGVFKGKHQRGFYDLKEGEDIVFANGKFVYAAKQTGR